MVEFVSHLNHEIRTPLTTIMGVVEILDNAEEKLTSGKGSCCRYCGPARIS